MSETPKQAYDRRKAERLDSRTRADFKENDRDRSEVFFEDAADRFVTAFERIADALENQQR